MQTLGLSDSMPKIEGRIKILFWPSIRNEVDVDYVGRQGFWICFGVAVVTLAFNLFTGSILDGIFESVFFFLGGVGVRARSLNGAPTFAAGQNHIEQFRPQMNADKRGIKQFHIGVHPRASAAKKVLAFRLFAPREWLK